MSKVKRTYIRLKPPSAAQPARQIIYSYLEGLRMVAGEWRSLPDGVVKHLMTKTSETNFKLYETKEFEGKPPKIEGEGAVPDGSVPNVERSRSLERSTEALDPPTPQQQGTSLETQEEFKAGLGGADGLESNSEHDSLLEELEQFRAGGGSVDSVSDEKSQDDVEGSSGDETSGSVHINLDEKTVSELREYAKERGIKGFGRMKKETLLERLQGEGGDE